MLPYPFHQFHYILASKSPRRQQLLKAMGFTFTVVVREIEEVVPGSLAGESIATYLSEAKATMFSEAELGQKTVLITADTIVWHNDKLLGKPSGRDDAKHILKLLSDSNHEVFTGITLKSRHQQHSFADTTLVSFRALTEEQIDFYIDHYQPFDKAGAYGVQEWIGYIGVKGITGSFYNVMGLPTQKLYPEMEQFLLKEEQFYKM
jgi:septum formation protein